MAPTKCTLLIVLVACETAISAHWQPKVQKVAGDLAVQEISIRGLCKFGRLLSCCYGWHVGETGGCEPICKPPCKNGKCVGPGKCKCLPGYTGKTCNHDLNECGLKPRPCKHRCMNTYGSFRCYCLNDYTLMSDGSCVDPWACSMRRCQYGCEDINGLVQCTCPSRGLHLASDGRTCLDVNECKMNRVVCSHHKTCVNTFGSYRCKCMEGFDLQYVHGKFQCKDMDECILGKHSCSEHATCYNTPGSYRCKCNAGFRGNGHDCSPTSESRHDPPNVFIGDNKLLVAPPHASRHQTFHTNEVMPIPRDIWERKKMPGYWRWENEKVENPENKIVPELGRSEEVDGVEENEEDVIEEEEEEHVDGVKKNKEEDMEEEVEEEEEEDQEKEAKWEENEGSEETSLMVEKPNKSRGDVYAVMIKCKFEEDICDWSQDVADNLDWELAHSDEGPYSTYMQVSNSPSSEPQRIARLWLALPNTSSIEVCLSFHYRLVGPWPGHLRIHIRHGEVVGPAVWERSGDGDETWRLSGLTLLPPRDSNTPQSAVFEVQQGRGNVSSIGLAAVVFQSGICPEHVLEEDEEWLGSGLAFDSHDDS
uniref:epidermal growth factor-like protein 6 isoform X2 n=1 Tax=Myxine glutinosa TaxID=7769 RepID=UPI00358DDEA8